MSEAMSGSEWSRPLPRLCWSTQLGIPLQSEYNWPLGRELEGQLEFDVDVTLRYAHYKHPYLQGLVTVLVFVLLVHYDEHDGQAHRDAHP